MNTFKICRRLASALVGASIALHGVTSAATPAELLRGYESLARQESAAFAGFSSIRGADFFRTTHGGEWSCASCHTINPTDVGRHARTGKVIAPLAPAANAKRFTDPARVEKWFRRNCSDVLGRECSAREKGDVLQFLANVR
jgi:hypothetical protein